MKMSEAIEEICVTNPHFMTDMYRWNQDKFGDAIVMTYNWEVANSQHAAAILKKYVNYPRANQKKIESRSISMEAVDKDGNIYYPFDKGVYDNYWADDVPTPVLALIKVAKEEREQKILFWWEQYSRGVTKQTPPWIRQLISRYRLDIQKECKNEE